MKTSVFEYLNSLEICPQRTSTCHRTASILLRHSIKNGELKGRVFQGGIKNTINRWRMTAEIWINRGVDCILQNLLNYIKFMLIVGVTVLTYQSIDSSEKGGWMNRWVELWRIAYLYQTENLSDYVYIYIYKITWAWKQAWCYQAMEVKSIIFTNLRNYFEWLIDIQ